MKKIKIILLLSACMNLLHAQNPLVKKWDYTYGGTNSEYMNTDAFLQTSDGGYLIGGFSSSDSGADKSQHLWGTRDYWIVKTNADGIKEWDKDFGAIGDDGLNALQQTSDGGYILGGYSTSNLGGDKTQPNRGDTLNPTADYWVVKIDSLGNKQWDKVFGGPDNDYLSGITKTADGGYILCGYSLSGIGGDKTQSSNGSYDFWIVKINSLGIKEWDKDYGGNDDDEAYSVIQTFNHGYLIAGFSASQISGTKKDPLKGILDYWIIRTDSVGNEQWEKDYGGSGINILYSMAKASDNGYLLAGTSNSPVSDDKTQPNWDTTPNTLNNDYWIIKIDSAGNKEWDKDYGGLVNESQFGNIVLTTDKGYLLTGTSNSNAGGDKSENNLGIEQNWIVKTDSIGNKLWDKTIFTTSEDETGFALQSTDGCYVLASVTAADSGGYKSQPSRGFADYWIVKFCDTSVSTLTVSLPVLTSRVSVFPNPFTSYVSINIQKQNPGTASFEIYDAAGKLIFRRDERNLSSNYTKTIDLHALASGIYFLNVTVDGERMVNKIVKE